jgi:four helix bundle protein
VATYVEGKFLIYSLASNDETKAHLELLQETKSLSTQRFEYFYPQYRKLGAMLYNLRQALIEGRAH